MLKRPVSIGTSLHYMGSREHNSTQKLFFTFLVIIVI